MITRVYINDELIDIDEQFKFAVDISINDIATSERTSDKTVQLKVPATKTNKKIFEFYEYNTIGKSNATVKGRVEVGSFSFEGSVVMYDGTKEDGIAYYNFQIVGGAGDWLAQFEQLSFSDIDFSAINYNYNITNIGVGGNIAFPPINYGASAFPWGLGDYLLPLDEIQPVFKCRYLFDKIFNACGYTLKGTFYDSALFNKLYLAPCKHFTRNITESDVKFRVGLVADDTCNFSPVDLEDSINFTEQIIHSDYIDTDDFFFYPTFDCVIKFKIKLKYTVNDRISENLVLVVRNAGTAGTATSENQFTLSPISGDDYFYTQEMQFFKGDQIFCAIRIDAAPDPITPISVTIDASSYMESIPVEIDSRYRDFDTLNIGDILKDISPIELLKSIKHKYNLFFYTDFGTRQILIESRDDFYTSSVMDWSSKLDTMSGVEVTHIETPRKTLYSHQEDSSDAAAEEYSVTRHNGLKIGQYKSENNNKLLVDEEEINDCIDAATVMRSHEDIGLYTQDIPYMTNDLNEPEFTFDYEPRLLYLRELSLPSGDFYNILYVKNSGIDKKKKFSITAVTDSSGVAAFALSGASTHLSTSDYVLMKGFTNDEYNGYFTINLANTLLFTLNSIAGDLLDFVSTDKGEVVLLDYYTVDTTMLQAYSILRDTSEDSLYFDTQKLNTGLFERYYKNEQRIKDQLIDGRIIPVKLEGMFLLNDADISGLIHGYVDKSMRHLVRLTQPEYAGDYYIDEISGYVPGGDELTKVTLIKKI